MQAHSALFIEACSCSPERRRLTGLENIGPERTLSGPLGNAPVNSPTRITLENNGKIRPEPDRKNAFARASGGAGGIRTLETVSRLHTFQACAFDHSATAPTAAVLPTCRPKCKGNAGIPWSAPAPDPASKIRSGHDQTRPAGPGREGSNRHSGRWEAVPPHS